MSNIVKVGNLQGCQEESNKPVENLHRLKRITRSSANWKAFDEKFGTERGFFFQAPAFECSLLWSDEKFVMHRSANLLNIPLVKGVQGKLFAKVEVFV